MELKLSIKHVGVGRILHLYHPCLRYEPQPCIVVGGPSQEPNTNKDGSEGMWGTHVNVNVFADGANYQAFLAELRRSPSGNTFTSVPLFDLMQPDQREVLMARRSSVGVGIWCEWPQ